MGTEIDELLSLQPLLQIFGFDPVYDCLFAHLPPSALIRVSRTCRLARGAVKDYSRRAYSINDLRRFFADPIGFRSLQARTGALISGSQALQFFERVRWPASDLDIYVWPETALEVAALIVKEGYEFRPFGFQPEELEAAARVLGSNASTNPGVQENAPQDAPLMEGYQEDHLRNVLSFEKVRGGETLKIQVMIPKSTPVAAILTFHSSECLG
ncbi:hypothetical protein M422DRAFT_158739 [Sphaerobolus stellatus SS14]|nr:hypothetical protein M422DRAFT_158739 [Sphaerobolus stellatus SS14]